LTEETVASVNHFVGRTEASYQQYVQAQLAAVSRRGNEADDGDGDGGEDSDIDSDII
jgi:hypothetical protein